MPVRVWVLGRPLAPGRDGRLALAPAVCLETAVGRIRRVLPAEAAPRDSLGGVDTVLSPAWIDSHVHLFACAADRAGTDLSRSPPASIAELLAHVAAAARRTTGAAWVRLSGYDEARLAEGRHPTRVELDEAAAGRPVRLRHATRHASVLSTSGWQALGDLRDIDTERVPRDPSGGPLGVGFGIEPRITAAVGPVCAAALSQGLAAVSAELLALGIVSVDEMSAANDPARVARLADAVAAGLVRQRVRVFLGDAEDAEAAHAAARGVVEVAGVKLLPRDAAEIRGPEFVGAVARARARGLPVAVHAVEADAIDAAVDVLGAAPPRTGADASPDRIEHASLCPPELVRRLAAAGLAVVTQPAFLFERGVKYVREVEPPLWPWLYPLASWRAAGIPVAGSSDAPVATADPRVALHAAVSRASAEGTVLGRDEALGEAAAWELYTHAPRRLRREASGAWPRDWYRAGELAELLVLDGDPRGGRWREIAVRQVVSARADSAAGATAAG